jgi:uncharacterized protein YcaQ
MTENTLILSQKAARKLALYATGLHTDNAFGKGFPALNACINQLGYVQIDTISVVERAHHHVLWARIPDYTPSWLEKALNQPDGLFEYWAHAAAFLPMNDYHFSLYQKQRWQCGANLWFKRDDNILQLVLDRITTEGALSSRDFEHKKKPGEAGWWNWKPAKKALEQLFLEGRLMVRTRKGFQKVFDLPERVLPAEVDINMPAEAEYWRHFAIKNLRALGIARLPEICYLRPSLKKQIQKTLSELIEKGLIQTAAIPEIKGAEYFVWPEYLPALNKIRYKNSIRILSPFDNLVIQRQRLKDLFNFNYQIECYVPPPKRKFGYFCLPLLHKDNFVGQIDCTADRKKSVLKIHAIHWCEPGISAKLYELLKNSLQRFAAFNNCNEIIFPAKVP